jgi:hypothetical protein
MMFMASHPTMDLYRWHYDMDVRNRIQGETHACRIRGRVVPGLKLSREPLHAMLETKTATPAAKANGTGPSTIQFSVAPRIVEPPPIGGRR